MIKSKTPVIEEVAGSAIADGEDQLLLIDDASFVSALTEAGQRCGKQLVCVRCLDPCRTLRAVVLLVDETVAVDEAAGSMGFCRDCYRELIELLFHGAVLRASRSTRR
jgi:hypothetical protein